MTKSSEWIDVEKKYYAQTVRRQPVVIVTDRVVAALHLDALQASLDRAGVRYETVILEGGERTKEFAGLESLIGKVLDTSAGLWVNLQRAVDVFDAEKKLKKWRPAIALKFAETAQP